MSTAAVPPSTTRSPAPRRRSLRTGALALAAAAVLLVPACGTGGDDEADDTTTTTEAAGETTTTGDETTTTEDGTTTTEGSGGGEVSADDLEALLPDESDIGADYVGTDLEDDEPSESDDEVAAACPEAAQFMNETGEDDRVGRQFETEDNREIEVKLDPTPSENFDEDTIDTVIDAVNACDVIELENNGINMEMSLDAQRDDTYGDLGVVMRMTALMDHPDFPAPVTLTFSNRAFVVGSVSVSLSATDGLTGATAAEIELIPGDHQILEDLAERLETDVADLQE